MHEESFRTREEEFEEVKQKMERFNAGHYSVGPLHESVPHIDHFQLTMDTPCKGVFLEGDGLYRVSRKRIGKRLIDDTKAVEFRLLHFFNLISPPYQSYGAGRVSRLKSYRHIYTADSFGYGPDKDRPGYSWDENLTAFVRWDGVTVTGRE